MSLNATTTAPEFEERRISLFLATVVSIAGTMFLIGTHQGIGMLPDSVGYMRLGHMRHDAPLYTWLLQVGPVLGFNIVTWASLVGLALLTVNVGLLFYVLKLVEAAPLTVYCTLSLIVMSPHFVGWHLVAMTEPLFITFMLSIAISYVVFFKTGATRWFILCAVLVGMAALVRFSAVPLGAAVATCMLLNGRHSSGERIKKTAAFAGLSSAIFLSWAVLSKWFTGTAIGRAMAFYGSPDSDLYVQGANTLSVLLLPTQVPGAIRYTALAVAIVLAGYLIVRVSVRPPRSTTGSGSAAIEAIRLTGLFVLYYVLFLIFSVHVEANLPFNGRYALPLYVFAVVSIALACQLQSGQYRPWMRGIGLVLVSLVVAGHTIRSADQVATAYADGIGYASERWRGSEIVRAVASLPVGATIFTNGPDALTYLTGRDAQWLPVRFSRRTGVDNPNDPWSAQMKRLRSALGSADTYIVYMDRVNWRFYMTSEEDLKRELPIKMIINLPDGRVYVES